MSHPLDLHFDREGFIEQAARRAQLRGIAPGGVSSLARITSVVEARPPIARERSSSVAVRSVEESVTSKSTSPEKPFNGAIVILTEAECPWGKATLLSSTVSRKSGSRLPNVRFSHPVNPKRGRARTPRPRMPRTRFEKRIMPTTAKLPRIPQPSPLPALTFGAHLSSAIASATAARTAPTQPTRAPGSIRWLCPSALECFIPSCISGSCGISAPIIEVHCSCSIVA